MMPDFGVGIYRFFFEPMVPGLYSIIEGRIKEQVAKYMPFLSIISIRFTTSDDDISMEANKVAISIKYKDQFNLALFKTYQDKVNTRKLIL